MPPGQWLETRREAPLRASRSVTRRSYGVTIIHSSIRAAHPAKPLRGHVFCRDCFFCVATAIDSVPTRDYIAHMAEDINVTFEHELKRLEKRVDALVKVCDQLQDENKSLKQRQDTLTAERANLLQKNEQVRARVEAMIGRLKAMEQGS